MTTLQLLRAGYGVTLLVLPGPPLTRLLGRPLDRRERTAARLLGARHLGQVLARRTDVRVDATHAASMVVVACLSARYRRPAVASAAVAVAFSVAQGAQPSV